jgi:hypothetical protein
MKSGQLRTNRVRSNRRHRGATLAEFVIVFPLAALFVLSLVQFGFIYMAKLQLNQATFMAARIGSTHSASKTEIREALIRGLSPFYQDSTKADDAARLATAYAVAKSKLTFQPWLLEADLMNPSDASFKDFGIKDDATGRTYIPNDNLSWRSDAQGPTSRQTIRDANLLKLRVVYGYEMKVPLIPGVLSRVLCGGDSGVEAWGNVSPWEAMYPGISKRCLLFYKQRRLPIESVATVEMQSRPER